jgi:hypothetical protein
MRVSGDSIAISIEPHRISRANSITRSFIDFTRDLGLIRNLADENNANLMLKFSLPSIRPNQPEACAGTGTRGVRR